MRPRAIIPVISALFFVGTTTALQCYTCGGQEDGSTSCVEFQSNEHPGYVKDCGADGKSCRLTREVSENRILSRSCEAIELNDCKTANSIEFCYCTKDLCNSMSPPDDEEDDEEQAKNIEGSGRKSESENEIENPIKPNTPKGDFSIEENEETKPSTQIGNSGTQHPPSSRSIDQFRGAFLIIAVTHFRLFLL
ncbi:uncharacterized protein LOC125505428 [Dendroctonus ponderosae]|uniref:Protein sleepless n=1 Tax=Dendroctonus ponderosae TaxID=77166 RepID=U4U988_DENPD|nr:uncharacterized protein LOC109534392 [Dendroctonus ponderosae]XP_048525159.1 uncharacterized protein LOC125505428 [Dendroctonus ponderosae]ERL84360.1 hypothetical protein D910_01785 [Dendroctonus ponderosae]ERL88878.1 hypothetical protein D910_06260 [Dendroctonus ponderosae]